MGSEVHLWRIGADDELTEVRQTPLNLEERLQGWIANDVSVLDPDLLVIGREVETDFGGYIDVLCLDVAGDLVVVELKRDKTPREITAQVLDYASWVAALSNERVTAIADRYLPRGVEGAFRTKYGTDLPESLNGDHRLLIVGSTIDSSSERIIKYLSETHGVSINAATFQYFRLTDGSELLARVFLIEPSEVDLNTRTKGASKRRPNLSHDELNRLAATAGVEDLYQHALAAFEPLLANHTTRSSMGFAASIDGSNKTIISLLPGESNADEGLRFRLYKNRYAELTKLPASKVDALTPPRREDWSYVANGGPDWEGYEGFIATREEIDRLAEPLRTALAGIERVDSTSSSSA